MLTLIQPLQSHHIPLIIRPRRKHRRHTKTPQLHRGVQNPQRAIAPSRKREHTRISLIRRIDIRPSDVMRFRIYDLSQKFGFVPKDRALQPAWAHRGVIDGFLDVVEDCDGCDGSELFFVLDLHVLACGRVYG